MKNILLIGIGGTGSAAIDLLYEKIDALGDQSDNRFAAIIFNTEHDHTATHDGIERISLSDTADIGTICDRIGRQYLKDWFPCDLTEEPQATPVEQIAAASTNGFFSPKDVRHIRNQQTSRDSSLWRKNAYLSFLNMLNRAEDKATFHRVMENLNQKKPDAPYDIYIVASIAGGTGSGAFLPIALYAHHYIQQHIGKTPQIHALIACPDIVAHHHSAEMQTKFYANAYAFLRELDAITRVTRGHNRNAENEGNAPIRFRLGHPDEPLAGLLFDAMDQRFWKPTAASIQNVFIVDKIPGVQSVEAHHCVLADTLYTILCTDVGTTTDSELSNHVLLNAQSNGTNAIYNVISTSAVQLPTESILHYLACEKAKEQCEKYWLLLHNRVQKLLLQSSAASHKQGLSANTCAEEYAIACAGEYRAMLNDPNNPLPHFLRESNNDAVIDEYFKKLQNGIARSLAGTVPDAIANLDVMENSGLRRDVRFLFKNLRHTKSTGSTAQASAENDGTKNDFSHRVQQVREAIFDRASACISIIKSTSGPLSDAVITLTDNDAVTSDDLSLIENLLKNAGAFCHPVSAMVRLCVLRARISAFFDSYRKEKLDEEWGKLSQKPSIEHFDRMGFYQNGTPNRSGNIRRERGRYARLACTRLSAFAQIEDEYLRKRTDLGADSTYLIADAKASLDHLNERMNTHITYLVLLPIAERLDLLIDEYRFFFRDFISAYAEMENKAARALHLDEGMDNSTLNVQSDAKHKLAFMEQISYENAFDEIACANVQEIGKQIFRRAFDCASRKCSSNADADHTSVTVRMNGLFDKIIEGYKPAIRNTDFFRKFSDMNVVEAIVKGIPDKNPRLIRDTLTQTLSCARELAKSSLTLDHSVGESKDPRVPRPSALTVLMMSYKTAKYIKKQAHLFEIEVPEGATEDIAIQVCAELFASKFVSFSSRVCVVREIPDHVLYVTDEILDIAPERITKFNECNPASYYRSYRRILDEARKNDSDRWNPHLGINLHKAGHLPFLNERMEEIRNVNTVKALLYALLGSNDKPPLISFSAKEKAFVLNVARSDRESDNVMTYNGNRITEKNIYRLFDWLRAKDHLTERWSAAFDHALEWQKSMLPPVRVDSETADDEIKIMIRSIKKSFYADKLSKAPISGMPAISDLNALANRIRSSTTLASASRDADGLLAIAAQIVDEFLVYRNIDDDCDALKNAREALLKVLLPHEQDGRVKKAETPEDDEDDEHAQDIRENAVPEESDENTPYEDSEDKADSKPAKRSKTSGKSAAKKKT